jgi:hypothetical protein
MRVENSGYIRIGHKLRQSTGKSSRHFVTALAQFGGHRLHSKRPVDAILTRRGDELAGATKAAPVEAHVSLRSERASGREMRLRSGG